MTLHRLAIAGLVLLSLGIAVSFVQPEPDTVRIAGLVGLWAGIAIFIGLAAYRILRQDAGKNILAETVENMDE
jgi:hypothetical protein